MNLFYSSAILWVLHVFIRLFCIEALLNHRSVLSRNVRNIKGHRMGANHVKTPSLWITDSLMSHRAKANSHTAISFTRLSAGLDTKGGSNSPDISRFIPGNRAVSTSTRWANTTYINTVTEFLLSDDTFHDGEIISKGSGLSLSQDIMDSAIVTKILNAWSTTNSVEGAQIVEKIVRRLLKEKRLSLLVDSRMYEMVCYIYIPQL